VGGETIRHRRRQLLVGRIERADLIGVRVDLPDDLTGGE
jgi:hypothetical protein